MSSPDLHEHLWMVADYTKCRRLETYLRHVEAPEGPEGSWWYDAGTERTAEMLERRGYRVVEADVGLDPRSPIVHFVRP